MNIDTAKDTVCINKIVKQKKETITVEGDSIVPDVKPDVITSIDTSGNLCIYKKELLDGKLRIDGTVDVYVVYLTEGDSSAVRGLNTSLNFMHSIEVDGCNNDMILDLNSCIKNIDCNVINGRKIGISANIEFDVKITQNKEEEILKQVEGIETIQKQNKTLSLDSMVGSGQTKVVVKDTIQLSDNEKIAEILKCNIDICNKEYKLSYNKILVKADSVLKIMYLTEENKICSVCKEIPIVGFIDIPNVSDDNLCDVNYCIRNIVLKMDNSSDNCIIAEIEVEISANVFENKNIEMICDLYDTDYDVKFETREIDTITNKKSDVRNVDIMENVPLDREDVGKVLFSEVHPRILSKNIMDDKLICDGEVEYKIIYEVNSITGIDSRKIILPFNTEISMANTKGLEVSLDCQTNSNNIYVENGNIFIDTKLCIIINSYKPEKIKIIDKLEVNETRSEKDNGMIVYFVKQNDTPWEIAKKFKTTIANICETNNIDEDEITYGKELFIVCCSKKRKLA